MKFSLIMATLGRVDEIDSFIRSLMVQDYKNYELIIVDQNSHREVEQIVMNYKDIIDIKYIRSKIKGISYNRNLGLNIAQGDVIAFPDDDCEYSMGILSKVESFFKENKELSIFSCKTLEKNKNYGIGKMLTKDSKITTLNIYQTVTSITFFVRVEKKIYIRFDENLGVGARFGSGEEIDYVLRLLHDGQKGRFFSNEIIYHPAKKNDYSETERVFNYGMGFGALTKKEVYYRKNHIFFMYFLKKIFRSFVGLVVTKNKKYHWMNIKGRIIGLTTYERAGN